jgi:hypothetical protein
VATIHVSLDGSDANNGSSLASAKRTIQAGINQAVSGDTVNVWGDTAGGARVYDETCSVKTGVTVQGELTRQKPVMDSNYTKSMGFSSQSGPTNAHIKNIEIRRYYLYGIRVFGPQTLVDGHPSAGGVQHNCTIQDCHIHHIEGRRTVSNEHAYGCYLVYGNWRVLNCEIHHINGWNESTGIWFGYTKNAEADGNTIYSIRKEGVRSYMGLNAKVTSNVFFLCWYAMCANEDAQSLWANNWASHCTGGMNPKHTNDPLRVLGYWGLTRNADGSNIVKCRFWHNTLHRCSWAQNVVAINDNGDGTGNTWDFDTRNNIYSGRSASAVWDSPGFRSGTWISDFNLFSTQPGPPLGPGAIGSGLPFAIYKTGFASNANQKTLAQVRTDLGLELSSLEINPALIDPDNGNLDYLNTSPAFNSGQDLTSAGSGWGAQMGARGLTPHRDVAYTGHRLTVLSSSTGGSAGSTSDEYIFSTNSADISTTPWVIVYDMGSVKTFNHCMGDVLSHLSGRNPKRWTLEVSDSSSGPWTLVADFTNWDSGGTGWRLELPSNPSGRYARFSFISTFSGTTVDVTEVRLGFLTNQNVNPEPDPGDTIAPSVTLTAPLAGAEITGTITLNAVASDNVGIDRVEFYADDTLLIATDQTDPYSAVWETTAEMAGSHSLTARAYDAAGNVTVSNAVLVTVMTPATPPEGVSDFWGVLA